jgi:hypothetical protein
MPDLPALHLAAFGKHPGWDDHLDDQGMETPWLVALKRKLYFEGVGANIDASTWEKLPAEQRLPGFEHEFLWRAHDGLALGRMSASRDGKGRGRYPFVLCAQTENVPLVWILQRAHPQLAELERQCQEATTGPDVVRHIDLIRGRLRRTLELARTDGEDYSAWFHEATGFDRLLRHDSLGANQSGLMRILYRLQREAPAWVNGASGNTAPDCLHLRLPSVSDTSAGAFLFWQGILLRLLRPEIPWLLIRHASGAWIDLLAGVPSTHSFSCLCANGLAIPLASDVPYQIDPEVRSRIEEWIRRLSADGGAMRSALPDTGAGSGGLSPLPGAKKGLWGGLKSLWGAG